MELLGRVVKKIADVARIVITPAIMAANTVIEPIKYANRFRDRYGAIYCSSMLTATAFAFYVANQLRPGEDLIVKQISCTDEIHDVDPGYIAVTRILLNFFWLGIMKITTKAVIEEIYDKNFNRHPSLDLNKKELENLVNNLYRVNSSKEIDAFKKDEYERNKRVIEHSYNLVKRVLITKFRGKHSEDERIKQILFDKSSIRKVLDAAQRKADINLFIDFLDNFVEQNPELNKALKGNIKRLRSVHKRYLRDVEYGLDINEDEGKKKTEKNAFRRSSIGENDSDDRDIRRLLAKLEGIHNEVESASKEESRKKEGETSRQRRQLILDSPGPDGDRKEQREEDILLDIIRDAEGVGSSKESSKSKSIGAMPSRAIARPLHLSKKGSVEVDFELDSNKPDGDFDSDKSTVGSPIEEISQIQRIELEKSVSKNKVSLGELIELQQPPKEKSLMHFKEGGANSGSKEMPTLTVASPVAPPNTPKSVKLTGNL